MPFDKTNGSDRTLLSEKTMSLRCSLGARLLRIEDRVLLLPSLTEYAEFARKLSIRI